MIRNTNRIKTLRNFVSDLPITDNSRDKFQTSQVADLMLEAIEHQQYPTHMALLGPWGSGKTSVLRMLEELIKVRMPNSFEIKFLSVWKFADDSPSLHRKIVREIERELGIHNPSGLDIEFVDTDETQLKGLSATIASFLRIQRDNSGYVTVLIALIAFGLLIWAASFSLLIPFLVALVPLVVYVLSELQRKIGTSKKFIALAHGDQYEERFEQAIDHFKKGNKDKKLILVFDDMDRLPPQQLVAALNTIKTFLRSKECVFIVPCDEHVLREGIGQVVKTTIDNGNESLQLTEEQLVSEFITKTFDLIFRLPALEQTNMKRYARNILLDQDIAWMTEDSIDIDRLLGILIHSGVRTPRQVKNMLNAFSMDWQLAIRRDKKAGRNLLTTDAQQLAIFSVLKTDFPRFFAQMSSNPYLLHDEEHEDDNLKAFLSRVRNYLPEDPRHFVYFNNSELNEIAGKAHVEKARDFLVNGQATEFAESFAKLEPSEKELVLRAFIDDLDFNAGIEVENALRVLLETKCMVRVPKVHESRWDELARQNVSSFTKYPLADVYRVLKSMITHRATWKFIGDSIKVPNHFKELVELWKQDSTFDQVLQLQDLGKQLVDAAQDINKGYLLLNSLFDLSSDHRMNSIDWLKLLDQTLSLDRKEEEGGQEEETEESNESRRKHCEFRLLEWLYAWSKVSDQPPQTSTLQEIMASLPVLHDEQLKGMGALWCQAYLSQGGIMKDIVKLTDLMVEKQHLLGFVKSDFSTMATFIDESGRKLVESFLSSWWEFDKNEAMEIFSVWSELPGALEFCYQSIEVDTQEPYRTNLTEYLLLKDEQFEYLERMIKYLNDHIDKEGTAHIISILAQSDHWRKEMQSYSDQWIPIQNPNVWYSWSDNTVKQKIKLFWSVCKDNKDKLTQLRQSINNMIVVKNGYPNYVSAYGNYLSNHVSYLDQIMRSVIQNIQFTDFADNIKEWNYITVTNLPLMKLLDSIDSGTKQSLLIVLQGRCDLSNLEYNNMFVEHADFSNLTFQQVAADRWVYLDVQQRARIISKLPEPEHFVQCLIGWAQLNNDPSLISEIPTWGLDDKADEEIVSEIIKHAPQDKFNTWISNAFDELNRVEDNWTIKSIRYAINLRSDISWPADEILETTLGLKDERTRLALEFITKYPQPRKRGIKEKVEKVSGIFPEEVGLAKNANSWRFRNPLRK